MKTFTRILLTALLVGLIGNPSTAQTDNMPFEAWHQGFEQDTEGWVGSDIPGAEGWCGSIKRHSSGSGPVAPSEGEGYAVVQHGECNAHWQEEGFSDSGPFAPGAGFYDAWPSSGYAAELDIYLDPAAGTPFDYVASIRLLDIEDFEESIRYFPVAVTMDDDRLLVAGNEVSEAGWYTFRHSFGREDGNLTVNFELVRDGEVRFSQPVTQTAFSEEATSSFAAANVGTGYLWFMAIADGLELAIDEHRVRSAD